MRLNSHQVVLYTGLAISAAGLLLLVIGALAGKSISPNTVLTLEPVSYAGALVLIAGLAISLGAYMINRGNGGAGRDASAVEWSKITQDYFDTFSRPASG